MFSGDEIEDIKKSLRYSIRELTYRAKDYDALSMPEHAKECRDDVARFKDLLNKMETPNG